MKKERRKIPPHARNVDAKSVAMTSSQFASGPRLRHRYSLKN
jgi:hypothetical protein